MSGPASLNGRFEIISGGVPSRAGYVKITAKKGGYLFARIGAHPVLTGVGVRIGDVLVVSYADRLSPLVTAFCPTAAGLSGLQVDSTLNFAAVSMTPAGPGAASSAGWGGRCQKLLDAAKP